MISNVTVAVSATPGPAGIRATLGDTTMKKHSLISAAAIVSAAMFATTGAEASPRRAGLVAAGVIGGLAVGAAVAAATAPTPVYYKKRRVRAVRVVPAYAVHPVGYGCVSSVYYGC
jgi:hypothetical protein